MFARRLQSKQDRKDVLSNAMHKINSGVNRALNSRNNKMQFNEIPPYRHSAQSAGGFVGCMGTSV
jgi:hypothetical protein